MLAKNETPFAAIAFEQYHRDGPPMGVVTCRATYNLMQDGTLELADKQELVLADEYQGDPLKTSLLKASDLTPFKPNTDITIIGNTYAPLGENVTEWSFGIEVDSNKRFLKAHGLRNWLPDGQKDEKPSWRMSDTTPVDFVPLDYRYAAGSSYFDAPNNDPNGFNPIGAKLPHPDYTPEDAIIPVAMIDSDTAPIVDPYKLVQAQGFGPIPPFWQQRMQFVGTTDDAWRKNRFPQLPADFNYLHYQSASAGMIWRGFMKGDETISLHGLTLGEKIFSFNLPSIQPYAAFDWIDDRQAIAVLNLDGVHIDMLSQAAPWQVHLTWRAWAVICPEFFKIDLFATTLNDLELNNFLGANEQGLCERLMNSEGSRQ